MPRFSLVPRITLSLTSYRAIYNPDPTVMSRSIYLFYRLCEKETTYLYPISNIIIAKCEEFIQMYENLAAKGGQTPLTLEDFISIFGIIGSLLSFSGIDKEFRN